MLRSSYATRNRKLPVSSKTWHELRNLLQMHIIVLRSTSDNTLKLRLR